MAKNPIQRMLDVTYGTARLLEGASTLVRARDANICPQQLQALYPDLKRLEVSEIRAFTDVSAKFFSGELRVSRKIFGKEMRRHNTTSPASASPSGLPTATVPFTV